MWRLATPPGSTTPTLFEQWCGFSYVPRKSDKCKCCETEPTDFPPYPTRLESLTVCRCHYKGSTFFSVFSAPECLSGRGFNPRSPAQKTDTLPTELTRRLFTRRITWGFIHVCTLLFIFLIPVQAGDCPNEENKTWKTEDCDACYCRNAIVYCPVDCA